MKLKQGSTSRSVAVFIGDSRSGTGAGLTGLVHNSAGLVAYYKADTAATATAISLVTATVGTFTSGGFKEIDATNQPGWYELGIPNAALSAGKIVTITLHGAANMVPASVTVELDQVDYQDGVRAGLTALPNAVFGATGGFGPGIVRAGTAQSGSTSSTLKLDAGASATADLYKGAFVLLTGGTGAGQARLATLYNGTTKVATVSPAWAVTPDDTSTFAIVATPNVDAIKAKVDLLSGPVSWSGPVDLLAGYTLNLVQGDGYELAGRVPEWEFQVADWPSMVGYTAAKIRFTILGNYTGGSSAPSVFDADADVSIDGATFTVRTPLSEAQTVLLAPPPPGGTTPRITHRYQIIISTADGQDVTPIMGDVKVTRRITPAA
jgi:energy-coupling factor transporter ATP-binding protein EcfA2